MSHVAQLCMHTRGTVSRVAGLVNLVDLRTQSSIDQLACAGRAAAPLVIATAAHLQAVANGIDGKGGLVCSNQRVDGVSASLLCANQAVAFASMSRSCFTWRSSRRKAVSSWRSEVASGASGLLSPVASTWL